MRILAILLLLSAVALLLGFKSASSIQTIPLVRPVAGEIVSSLPSPVPLAPDVASYVITATLSSDGTSIAGEELVTYRNPGAGTLTELYFHLYLNAFRSLDTVWMREAAQQHRGISFDPERAGSIAVDAISSDGRPLALSFEGDETIASVHLPQPLPPGRQVVLALTWTARLPRVFARTGWAPSGFTLAGQWYPKLAVYDERRGGWDREPWHANAEFFHDFGSYELSITAPSRRTIVASGEPVGVTQNNGDGTSTARFRASSVTDVVWMAGERYAVKSQAFGDLAVQVALPSDRISEADHHLSLTARALQRYGDWLGPYPWPRITVVFPPSDAEGAAGMEYPGFVTSLLQPASLPEGVRLADVTTAHELGHQWFPMQVASDEARDPWLDEAFADYLAQRVMAELYGADRSMVDLPFVHAGYLSSWRIQLPIAATLPITKPSWEYTTQQYSAAVYAKGGLLLTTLERVFGGEAFSAALRDYVTQWRWRHPLPADFRQVLAERLDRPAAAAASTAPQQAGLWLDQLAFGERVLDLTITTADRDRALVERKGDAALPVEGILYLESGRRVAWSLPAESNKLEVPAPQGDAIVAAGADPESRLLLESNRLDDSFSVSLQSAPLLGLWAKLAQLLALSFQGLGQMG